VRRKQEERAIEENSELPLVCGACKGQWSRRVGFKEKRVQCPYCQSFSVSVLAPCKILDLERRGPYNQSGAKKRLEVPAAEPAGREPAAKRAPIIKLQDLREVAEAYEEIEVVGEIG
jgi:hypothetical protein